ASDRAIPSPMPLVEPVTSETLPASGLAPLVSCAFIWIFMTNPFPRFFGVLGRNQQDGRGFRKCPLASESIGGRYRSSDVIAGPDGLVCTGEIGAKRSWKCIR